ncbi:MAG TPA: isocitrate lyase/PEP mutase family protein [Candidatus Elarobacter sp.]|nr:isocitrate lyase/PEP mutase family protein [Candidatus Elarobacter sp.]
MSFGTALRHAITQRAVTPFIGVYDVFSASIAAQHYDALFVSGFGFAASHYGLPDIGFIAWPDIVAFVERVRTVLPGHHLLVDIDDGYCDPDVACHVVSLLERAGASGVVLEDQRRPRRCGHFDGKQLLELDEFIQKLERVLATRRDLFVVARTDASDVDDIFARLRAFVDAGADAVLVDGIRDLDVLRSLRRDIDLPIAFNQIAGGKSRPCTTTELVDAGATMIIYSTPCLFAAQQAMDVALRDLAARDGLLPVPTGGEVGVAECTRVLSDNLARRDTPHAAGDSVSPRARTWTTVS